MRRCHVEVEALRAPADPVALARRLRHLDGFSALIGAGTHPDARWSVLAALPREEVAVAAKEERGDPFAALAGLVGAIETPREAGGPPGCGVIAMLGYDLRTRIERLPDRHPADATCPDLLARAFDAALVVDGRAGTVELRRLVDPRDDAFTSAAAGRAARLREAATRADVPSPVGSVGGGKTAVPFASLPRRAYEDAVRAVLDLIRAGEVYQVNFAQRMSGPWDGDPFALLERVARENPAPFGGLVALASDSWLLSASPERFLTVDGAAVVTRPIKGTAGRGDTPDDDRTRADALRASVKDRAELAMIVDLLRNDLARSCVPGSVVVTDPMALETHPTVHHLVATVSGALAPGRGAVDVVRAAWPGGSITGVPKIRAMEVIDALEAFRRGPYTGSLGWFSHDGRADLNILIRSIRLAGAHAWLHAGGGVTIRSDPEAEWRESCVKVRGLLDALCWSHPDGP